MKRSEGSEVPGMLPCLLPHDSLVITGLGSILGLQHEAVVDAGNHLGLALDDLDQLQVGPRSLVVLGHRVIRDLRHVGVVLDVLDGCPAAGNASQRGSGEGGDRSEDKEGDENKAVRSHGSAV